MTKEQETQTKADRVLVTGASGYLAIHCVQQLLDEGYQVRGTVRSKSNPIKVNPLTSLRGAAERLELFEADLEQSDTWPSAVAGCRFILHVASPFPIVADEKIIRTAIDGTLNILQAAAQCSDVKKVVLTSSCAAINEGHTDQDRVFTEKDWTNTDSPTVLNYAKSKTLAERAAWDFMDKIGRDENRFALTCLNPTLIVGPLLMDVQGASISIVRRFMNGEMPAVPHMQLALVDVRDVARAHIRAMRSSRSDGQRILITAQPSFWFFDIAKVLAKEFGSQGYRIPKFQVPYFVAWLYSFVDAEARQILDRIGHEIKFDNSKAKDLLDLEFKDPAESLVEMAYSMIERGILRKRPGYRSPNRPPSEMSRI